MTIRNMLLFCIFTVMALFVAATGWLSVRGMASLQQELARTVHQELLNEGATDFRTSVQQFCAVYENLPETSRSGDPARDLAPFMVADEANHYLMFDGTGAPVAGHGLVSGLAPLATPETLRVFFDEALKGGAREITIDNYMDYLAGNADMPAVMHLRAYPEDNLLLGMGRLQLSADIRSEVLAANAEAIHAKLMRRGAGLYFCLMLLVLTLVWLVLQHLFFKPLLKTMAPDEDSMAGSALTWPRFKEHAHRISVLAEEKQQLRSRLEREIEARYQAEEERDLLKKNMERSLRAASEELRARWEQRLQDVKIALMRREARVLNRRLSAPLEAVLQQLPTGPEAGPLRAAVSQCIATVRALGGDASALPHAPQDVSLQPWLERLVEDFRETHANPVTTNICNGTHLEIDPDSLRGAIVCVMENAVLASSEGAGISVDAVRTPDGVEIRIVDRGAGVAPDMRAHIAVPFYTLNDEADGLGLAATKAVVERHGGTLTLQSETDKGTAVIIRLPVAPAKN